MPSKNKPAFESVCGVCGHAAGSCIHGPDFVTAQPKTRPYPRVRDASMTRYWSGWMQVTSGGYATSRPKIVLRIKKPRDTVPHLKWIPVVIVDGRDPQK